MNNSLLDRIRIGGWGPFPRITCIWGPIIYLWIVMMWRRLEWLIFYPKISWKSSLEYLIWEPKSQGTFTESRPAATLKSKRSGRSWWSLKKVTTFKWLYRIKCPTLNTWRTWNVWVGSTPSPTSKCSYQLSILFSIRNWLHRIRIGTPRNA